MKYKARVLIRDFAEECLKFFNGEDITSDCIYPINVMSFIEKLNGTVEYNITDITVDGRIKYLEKKENQPYDFVIEIQDIKNEERKRFTLAHELAHLILHMDFFDDEERKNNNEYHDNYMYRKSGNYSEEELQANEFAASLLMPSKKFIEIANKNRDGLTFDIDKIAQFFQVSNIAALTRGRWLGLFRWD